MTGKQYVHCAVRPGKRAAPERLTVVVEEEPVDSQSHLLGQLVVLLVFRLRLVDPILHLRLPNNTVAVQLIATPNQRVKRLFGMVSEEIHPDRIVAALEPRPPEVVGVHAGTEAIALCPL